MSDQLSEKYLLYLRDMSRKVVYGSGSSGNSSDSLSNKEIALSIVFFSLRDNPTSAVNKASKYLHCASLGFSVNCNEIADRASSYLPNSINSLVF